MGATWALMRHVHIASFPAPQRVTVLCLIAAVGNYHKLSGINTHKVLSYTSGGSGQKFKMSFTGLK